MPLKTTQVVNIVCDNPNCPKTSTLDPAKREGWFFVTSEIYGESTQQHVFCDGVCAAAAATDQASDFASPPQPTQLPA